MNTVKKAIEHFIFKLNPENNIWKATEADIKAIKLIAEYFETKSKEQFNANQLFGKLYITFYGELLLFYNTTVFDKIPSNAINKILNTPMETIIRKFLNKANLIEQTKDWMDESGGKHPILSNTSKINPEAESMTYNEAVEQLEIMINAVLNKYR